MKEWAKAKAAALRERIEQKTKNKIERKYNEKIM